MRQRWYVLNWSRALKATAIVIIWFLVYFFIVGLASRCSSAAPHATTLHACTFSIMNRGGELVVFYERAVIVAEVAGKDEWWLNFPDREPVFDKEGHARAVNFPKARVLRVGEARVVGTSMCRCPESFQ
jgi:hypothetical protein